ncbi:hypothetical protein [Lysobacter sp. Root983]|uniref:hypothetical protein n=1 Tax=Lysobacter sp. Root983 TaxID=1736613 RepID=UPI00070FB8E0|nr:hypothetical protein [Lysobacter sp. Root983]KRD79734.1 hypothetical protein ASE43_02205 [Lysobacter sp. Root983]
MPKITQNDLHYQYSWHAVPGDNPHLIDQDANHLSRNEGYEMLQYLNSLKGPSGADLPVRTRLIVEWMLKEHFHSTAPGRSTVTQWVVDNYQRLSPLYPR